MSTSISCTQAQALIMESFAALPADEFLLDASDEALLLQHLAACADCRAHQSHLRQLTASLKSLEPVEVPAGLTDRIMQAVEVQGTPAQPMQGRQAQKKRFGLFLSIAATVLLLVLAFPALKTEKQPEPGLVAKTSSPGMTASPEINPSETAAYTVDTSQIASARTKAEPAILDELAFAGGQFESDSLANDPVGNLVGF